MTSMCSTHSTLFCRTSLIQWEEKKEDIEAIVTIWDYSMIVTKYILDCHSIRWFIIYLNSLWWRFGVWLNKWALLTIETKSRRAMPMFSEEMDEDYIIGWLVHWLVTVKFGKGKPKIQWSTGPPGNGLHCLTSLSDPTRKSSCLPAAAAHKRRIRCFLKPLEK